MIEQYLQSRIATSKEMQNALGLTARQVMHRLKKLGNRVVQIKNGRSPRYALTRPAFGEGDEIPIWEVDAFGKHSHIASLRPLSAGGFFLQAQPNMPKVFLGESGNGLYDDLPYFLIDMAPKGYLGRQVAQQLAQMDSRFPAHLSDWQTEHIGRYLLANADGNIGNLKFGNNATLKKNPNIEIKRSDYHQLADRVLSSDLPASSAGGEQPKFTAYCADNKRHVLVKFSPKGSSEVAQRWRDILLTEHYAAQAIQKVTLVTAAQTQVFEQEGRLFLESIRFDRSERHGRYSMMSLAVIDAEFVGNGSRWLHVCEALYEQKLISHQDLFNVAILECFAKLIYNTDTHLGNMSFEAKYNGFSLLPIYDMCSMGFAPKGGEVLPFAFKMPTDQLAVYEGSVALKALEAAHYFWVSLMHEPLISRAFRRYIMNEVLFD